MPPYQPNRPSRRSTPSPLSDVIRGPSLPLLGLAAGTLLGLVLGLIIGWLVLPVQWTNAWPGDLSDEARAQYLAAVAESYVYYGNEQAEEIARNRLFDLNENLAEEIAGAQRFFTENPQGNTPVYITNLGRLAQALDVQSPDIIIETPAGDTAGAAAAAEAAETGSSVRSWVNWLMWLVAAAALIGGGLYLLSRLSRRSSGTSPDLVDDEPEGFDDEDEFASRPGRNPFQRPVPSPLPTSVREADRTRDRTAGPYATPAREQYGFDEEHDETDAFGGAGTIEPLADEDEELYDEAMLDLEDEEFERSAQDATTYVMAEDEYGALAEAEEVDQGGFVQPGARSGQGTLLKTFSVHYQAGIPDYDQSYSIMDPSSGRYVGECGMGVNLKNGMLQNNPDSVIALDVWLVDKLEERTYSSQSRVLLSKYVVDNNLESAFTRERPDDAPPVLPQPGMTFDLDGDNLVLECEVREVKYTSNGPSAGLFQSVKLDMTVRAKV